MELSGGNRVESGVEAFPVVIKSREIRCEQRLLLLQRGSETSWAAGIDGGCANAKVVLSAFSAHESKPKNVSD